MKIIFGSIWVNLERSCKKLQVKELFYWINPESRQHRGKISIKRNLLLQTMNEEEYWMELQLDFLPYQLQTTHHWHLRTYLYDTNFFIWCFNLFSIKKNCHCFIALQPWIMPSTDLSISCQWLFFCDTNFNIRRIYKTLQFSRGWIKKVLNCYLGTCI